MDLDLAKRLLREASNGGVSSVLFSGGEPLARFDHALPIISAAHSLGHEVAVCTNANWARDPNQAKYRIAQLVEAGTTSLLLSTDRWHLQFIPLEAVVNAALAGRSVGMKVQISVPSGAGDFQAISLATKLRGATGVDVVSHPVHPIGRGKDLSLRITGITPPDLGGCHLAGHIEVDYNGSVSICPTSAEFGPNSPLVLGDANRVGLDVLVNNYRRTPWYALIRLWGPLGAHLLAGGERDLSDRPHETALHPCHLCGDVNASAETAERASSRLGVDLLAPMDPRQFSASLALAAEVIAGAFAAHEQFVEIK